MSEEETKLNELTIKEFEELVEKKIEETSEVKRKEANREEIRVAVMLSQLGVVLSYVLFTSLLGYTIFSLFSIWA